jgi:ribonuclease P protein component
LCSRKQIDLLFLKNTAANAYPLKAVFIETEEELQTPLQVMFVVPKRIFKHAHDRNTLKRRMRESYRLNKSNFYTRLKPHGKKYIVAFIYTGKKEAEYLEIDASVIKLLNVIVKKAEAKPASNEK